MLIDLNIILVPTFVTFIQFDLFFFLNQLSSIFLHTNFLFLA